MPAACARARRLLLHPVAPAVLRPAFRRLGCLVGRHPWKALLASLCVVGACASGLLRLESDTSYDLWYPQRSQAFKDKLYIEQHFKMEARAERVIMTAKQPGGALTVPALVEATALINRLADGTFQDLCMRAYAGAPCAIHSLLGLWGFNATKIVQDPDVATTLSRQPLIGTWGQLIDAPTTVGGPAFAGDLRGGAPGASSLMHTFLLDVEPGSASQVSEAALRANEWEQETFVPACLGATLEHWTVFCMGNLSWKTENERLQNSNTYVMAMAMGAMIIYVCVALGAPPWEPVRSKCTLALSIMASVGMSLGVAFGLTAFFGVPFTIMSFLAIFIILGVGIDDMFILFDAFQRTDNAHPLDERLGEALEAIGCSITLTSLTDGLAFCVGSMIDLPAISAFCIAAGIATLSVFLVQATFFASILVLDARREQANRFDLLPCFHGPAPSLSSTPAPPISSSAPPPATEASIGHAHVARRELQGDASARLGSLPVACLSQASTQVLPGEKALGAPRLLDEHDTGSGDAQRVPRTEGGGAQDKIRPQATSRLAGRMLQGFGDRCLRDGRRRVLVAACFAALAIGMGVLAYKCLSRGSNWSDFLPRGSYVLEFLEQEDAQFGAIGRFYVYFDHTEFDLSSAGDRAAMRALHADLAALTFFMHANTAGGASASSPAPASAVDSWFQDFERWVAAQGGGGGGGGGGERVDHVTLYEQWRNSDASRAKVFFEDLALDMQTDADGSRRVVGQSRLSFLVRLPSDTTNWDALVERMQEFRTLCQLYNAGPGEGGDESAPGTSGGSLGARGFSPSFLFLERYRYLSEMTLQCVAGCLLGVLLINLLFLPALNAILVVVSILLVTVNLLGWMVIFGVQLNIASLVNIVLAIGFSVDYSAHIAEAFSASHISSLSHADRAITALVDLGGSVFNGGFSTLLASVLLFASEYEGYRVMALMFSGFVLFGLLHGLLLLPVMLIATADFQETICGVPGGNGLTRDVICTLDAASPPPLPPPVETRTPTRAVAVESFSISG